MKRNQRLVIFAATVKVTAICLTSQCWANTANTPTPLRVVARTNTTYPGTYAPEVISYFNPVTVDAAGFATFDAFDSSRTVHSIWSERDGGLLREIVQTGDPHPSTISPYHFSVAHTQDPKVANDTIVFLDEFADAPGASGLGVWVSAPGHSFRLAATTKANPEVVGPHLDPSIGDGLFFTNVTSSGYVGLNIYHDIVYESSPDNSISRVVSHFDAAPGVPSATFTTVGDPRVNESGQIAWDGTLQTGGSVTATSMFGLWKQLTPGVGTLVARQGNPAPGTPGVPFNRFSSFALNNDGGVAFLSDLLTSNTASAVGIWREKPGQGLQAVMVEGDAAPGTSPGDTFGNISRLMHAPVYNPSSNIVFNSNLIGPGVAATNDSGLWEYNGQSTRLVVREGDPAPGTEPGTVFDDVTDFQYTVNGNGRVAFYATLRGPAIDRDTNSSGIWAEGLNGLTLIARLGDYFRDGNGNTFQLGSLHFDPAGLSDSGYVGFWANDFGDSTKSGAYASALAAVPEPASLALVFTLCLVGSSNRAFGLRNYVREGEQVFIRRVQ